MTGAGTVVHANQTRNRHFRELLSKPLTLVVIVALALVGGGIAFGVGSGVGIAAAIAGGLLVFTLLTVFAIADSRAAEDFYRAYASARGLTTGSGRGHLPPEEIGDELAKLPPDRAPTKRDWERLSSTWSTRIRATGPPSAGRARVTGSATAR